MNYNEIQWIADGEVIAEGESIALQDYSDKISCYVRAQLIGDGGICLTQAFILDDGTLGKALPFIEDTKYEKLLDKSTFRIRSMFHFVLAQEAYKSVKRRLGIHNGSVPRPDRSVFEKIGFK